MEKPCFRGFFKAIALIYFDLHIYVFMILLLYHFCDYYYYYYGCQMCMN